MLATQGLEFPWVLLELSRTGWLLGGGCIGVGRVYVGPAQGPTHSWRFSGSSAIFAAQEQVLDWY